MPETRQASDSAGPRNAESSATQDNSPRKRWKGRVASLACLIVAAVAQYFLVNIPIGEVGGQFPASVRARAEAVAFSGPSVPDGGTFSLQYAPPSEAQPVLLDAYFDNGQLAPETLQSFRALQVDAPAAPGPVTYLTSNVKKGSCSTKFAVLPVSAPTSVQFSQTDDDSLADFRSVAISFASTDVDVTLTSQGPTNSVLSPCKVNLSVGNWNQVTGGFFPIKIRVPAGASFRFRWEDLTDKSDAFQDKSKPVDLLRFGASNSQDFAADTIKIVNVRSAATDPPQLEARGTRKTTLDVESLSIDKSALQIKASGKGEVLKDGKVQTKTDVLEAFNQNPVLSGLITAGNVALLGWAGRMWFPLKKKKRDEE
jgi:hypothetical protein